MSGKVLSILALSLMLSYLLVSPCCQGVKSYTGPGPAAPYKQREKDPSFWYRGLTHDTVLAALQSNHDAALVAALSQGADVKFDGDTLHLAIWSRGCPRDLRADTVLLALTVDQHFHGVFEEFDCSFFDPLAPCCSQRAALKLSKLCAFGRGKPGREQLLGAVQLGSERDDNVNERYQGLSYRQILDQSAVLEGAYAAERKELSDELTTLKANGYDVNEATRQFFALEDLVRTRQYKELLAAFARTRQSIAEAVAKAQGISVATSRTQNWQR
jgi:hypothetical protein